MKSNLLLTQSEKDQCWTAFIHHQGDNRPAVYAAVQKALDLAAAKLPEFPKWVQLSERRPTKEDSMDGWVVWSDRAGNIVFNYYSYVFNSAFAAVAWYPLTKYVHPEPTPEQVEEAKFQEWLRMTTVYSGHADAVREIFKSIRAIK